MSEGCRYFLPSALPRIPLDCLFVSDHSVAAAGVRWPLRPAVATKALDPVRIRHGHVHRVGRESDDSLVAGQE